MPKHDDENKSDDASGMRLDKWLWCARFYKTRNLAADAVRNGRVLVNGTRTKPSKLINTGARIIVSKAPYRFEFMVKTLPGTRKSAADAASLFSESADSVELRSKTAMQLKLDAGLAPRGKGRPTRRERRALLQFKNHL